MNTISQVSIFGGLFILIGLGGVMAAIVRSPYVTEVGVVREQPVPFSHAHHVGDAGIDCRYCHTSVETSAFAGIPPTSTCMKCHAELWSEASILEPVRESYRQATPLRWTRVHDLPDFVYFNHSIHVAKGVACASCHGDVARMPLMWRENTLHMSWCLDCHRDPTSHIGPVDRVFDSPTVATISSSGHGKVAEDSKLDLKNVKARTDCYVCHR